MYVSPWFQSMLLRLTGVRLLLFTVSFSFHVKLVNSFVYRVTNTQPLTKAEATRTRYTGRGWPYRLCLGCLTLPTFPLPIPFS